MSAPPPTPAPAPKGGAADWTVKGEWGGGRGGARNERQATREVGGSKPPAPAPKGGAADWTDERGTSEEGSRRVRAPRRRKAELRNLAPLIAVTVAAGVFTVLLIAVRLRWGPFESADHAAAARLNSLIAGHPALVAVVKAVTWLGSDGVLWTVLGVSAAVLAVRRRWRLAATCWLPARAHSFSTRYSILWLGGSAP